MDNDLIQRVAFAIQDGTIHRLKAQRIARAVIAAIENGDALGRGMFAVQRAGPAGAKAIPTGTSPAMSAPGDNIEVADLSTLKPIGDGLPSTACASLPTPLVTETRPLSG